MSPAALHPDIPLPTGLAIRYPACRIPSGPSLATCSTPLTATPIPPVRTASPSARKSLLWPKTSSTMSRTPGRSPSTTAFPFDEGLIPYTKFSDYFRTYGRKEPLEPTHQPHGFGWGVPEKNFWDAVEGQRLLDFNVSMQTLDQMLPVIGIYPFEWIAQNADKVSSDAPLIVDVGGGKGQVLAQIRRSVPEIPAKRLVLQDREVTIEDAEASRPPELEGAKFIAHDFFKPQPVKGALVYFFRRIMHDWSDRYNAQILGHCRDVMTPHSRILIMDQVMANPPSTLSAQTDICMMNLGAKDRTAKDWHTLVGLAGLDLVKIWKAPSTEVSVIECKLRSSPSPVL
ncbi:O-methyltransferase family 2 [Macrophomina phaseolina MS6]|uniref:O-methyltransferase family 2 n=1 Tax=Macrophomina phaseolina (strain MS6) TaxID=1126212 RepID=K2QLR5_MACPH|nr:O-methyltransferase family 2 [Macrophomina phaseolina MS6]